MERDEIMQSLYQILIRKNPVLAEYSFEKLSAQTLDEAGLDSLGLLNFMVAIENDLGIEWDEDRTTPGTLKSLSSIANYIQHEFEAVK